MSALPVAGCIHTAWAVPSGATVTAGACFWSAWSDVTLISAPQVLAPAARRADQTFCLLLATRYQMATALPLGPMAIAGESWELNDVVLFTRTFALHTPVVADRFEK